MDIEFRVYYVKNDDGTYNVITNIDGKDIASFSGVSQERFDNILKDYPNARLIDITDFVAFK